MKKKDYFYPIFITDDNIEFTKPKKSKKWDKKIKNMRTWTIQSNELMSDLSSIEINIRLK